MARRINPEVISSSGTSAVDFRSHFENTGVRKKTSATHRFLAEVIAESGEKLVQSLHGINESNREIECNRLDISLQIFNQNM